MSRWDELNDEYQDEWEDDEEAERDPDDCMDCGQCENCIEQMQAVYEELEKPQHLIFCDCEEDATKLYGGHKKDCPNAIPF